MLAHKLNRMYEYTYTYTHDTCAYTNTHTYTHTNTKHTHDTHMSRHTHTLWFIIFTIYTLYLPIDLIIIVWQIATKSASAVTI